MYFLCIGLPNILMCELIRCAKLAHDAWVQYQRIECLGAGTGCCATQYECVARRSIPPFTRWETNAANTLYPPLLAGNQIQPPLQPPTGDLLAKHLLLLFDTDVNLVCLNQFDAIFQGSVSNHSSKWKYILKNVEIPSLLIYSVGTGHVHICALYTNICWPRNLNPNQCPSLYMYTEGQYQSNQRETLYKV